MFTLRIYRGTPRKQYWEEFSLQQRPSLNIIASLMEIQRHPVNKEGKKVEPVVWEDGCLEEVCGSCSMLINGRPRQACTAIISVLLEETGKDVITLSPLSKFPLVRDLIVDRSIMFDNLKKVSAWIEVESTWEHGPGPKISQEKEEVRYSLSTCFTCGCCSEACPQVNEHSKFMGPAPISQVRLFNSHPTGRLQKGKRLHALMEEGGLNDCGNAQNCVRVCPKGIPLTDSIAALGRDVTLQAFRDLLGLPDRDE